MSLWGEGLHLLLGFLQASSGLFQSGLKVERPTEELTGFRMSSFKLGNASEQRYGLGAGAMFMKDLNTKRCGLAQLPVFKKVSCLS